MRTARSALLRGIVGLRAASAIVDELKGEILQRYKTDLPKMQDLRNMYGTTKLNDATIDAAYNGMRGVTALVYESSLLDPVDGIRYRDLSIPELQKLLPRAAEGIEPLPEAVLWLLLTGNVPSEAQTRELTAELHRRADPEAIADARRVIDALPANTHSMTAYSAGIMALQPRSKFAAAYASGTSTKKTYWEYALEDGLDLLARTADVAALIYNRVNKGKTELAAPHNAELDWAANFVHMLGFTDKHFCDCMRLYLSIHADHEGGNVSTHTATLVASALSDPYLAVAAGLNGLAGPLHGLANQEVLGYLRDMQERLKKDNINTHDEAALEEALSAYTWDLLNAGHVVPGFGHAVLRRTDPRYTCLREFCHRNLPDDELFRVVNAIYKFMPALLTKHGKTKNPYPNVDAHSGVVLQHYGLTNESYYTVLFGVSRQLGFITGIVWDRLAGKPIERPKSITTNALAKKYLTTSL